MKKTDNQTTYLFMTGVVAIVAIVALVLSSSGGNLEGAAAVENPFCSDDDPGNVIDVMGTVELGIGGSIKTLKPDYCLNDDKTLVQYYCGSSQSHQATYYDCPKGCSNGVCK